jgi:ABC-type transport system involved in multi-copper enzyme maturation permease subunit
MFGPIFLREWLSSPRRTRHYTQRIAYVAALFSLVCTVWLLLAGLQQVRNLGDFSQFGMMAFQIVAPFQLIVLMFLAAVAAANQICHEKDRRTFDLLLLTELSNSQIVLGKFLAGLLNVLQLFLASIPLLLLLTLLGGVSPRQVLAVCLVTAATIFWSASLGTTIAFWREKTFQTLAMITLGLVLWCVIWEPVAAGWFPFIPSWIATAASPLRAVWFACQPPVTEAAESMKLPATYTAIASFLALLLCTLSILRLRVWNPSRQVQPRLTDDEAERLASEELGTAASWKVRPPRPMWNNPVMWREIRTWAYGKKVLVIRIAYFLLAAMVGFGLFQSLQSGELLGRSMLNDELLPSGARILAPLFLVSLVIINALAVNSITNERDGQALDLLLVTEISPWEFLFGKLVGVMYVAKEMVLFPLLLCLYVLTQGGLSLENFIFILVGWIVMTLFVSTLGIHCGMIYSQSRSAISVSLGTVFFLFLGIVTCMLIMISFRGSFGRQLAPFLLIILGGGTGLYLALGQRNPSPAIALASFALPFLTFFAMTSYVLRNQELTVVSVITAAYGFATAAMLIPALSEFDFATGRAKTVDEEI